MSGLGAMATVWWVWSGPRVGRPIQVFLTWQETTIVPAPLKDLTTPRVYLGKWAFHGIPTSGLALAVLTLVPGVVLVIFWITARHSTADSVHWHWLGATATFLWSGLKWLMPSFITLVGLLHTEVVVSLWRAWLCLMAALVITVGFPSPLSPCSLGSGV